MAVSNIAFAVVTLTADFTVGADITTTFLAEQWIMNLQAAAADTDAVVAFSFDGTNIHGQLNLAKVPQLTVPYREKKIWFKKVSGVSAPTVAVTALGPLGKV